MTGNPAGWPSFVVESGSTPARWLPALQTLCQNKMSIARTLPELPDPWPFDQEPDVVAVTCTHITRDGLPVLLVTHYDDDDSWGFQSGQPVTIAEAQLVAMKTVFGLDPTIVEVADLEPGWSAVRESVGSQWVRYKDTPEDEETQAQQAGSSNGG
jgi:hypothetical protein